MIGINKKTGNTKSRVLKDRLFMSNPLRRMRAERRLALFFLLLVLAAAVLMQLLGYALQEKHHEYPLELPMKQVESGQ